MGLLPKAEDVEVKDNIKQMSNQVIYDPVGKFGCYVLSTLFVVGAGLGCTVKKLSK